MLLRLSQVFLTAITLSSYLIPAVTASGWRRDADNTSLEARHSIGKKCGTFYGYPRCSVGEECVDCKCRPKCSGTRCDQECCDNSQTCYRGKCIRKCSRSETTCFGNCCKLGESCRSGRCVSSQCPGGQERCSGVCCKPGQTCRDGRCVNPPPQCAAGCPTGQSCQGGSCQCTTPGRTTCGTNCCDPALEECLGLQCLSRCTPPFERCPGAGGECCDLSTSQCVSGTCLRR